MDWLVCALALLVTFWLGNFVLFWVDFDVFNQQRCSQMGHQENIGLHIMQYCYSTGYSIKNDFFSEIPPGHLTGLESADLEKGVYFLLSFLENIFSQTDG
jgi:hypothetical protein